MARKIIILLVIVFGIVLRLYNFSGRINFGMEQGMSLSMTASYLYERISLLGMSNVARVTNDGHMVLINPLYNYMLMPFMLVLGRDPITLTYLAFGINMATAYALYWIAKRLYSSRIALFSAFFFLFNLTMIEHSLTLWIHNIVPLAGIISFYYLVRLRKEYSSLAVFMVGLMTGMGYAMEYMYLFTAIIIGFYLLISTRSEQKFKSVLIFSFAFAIPQLPAIIFDLRNNFYNLRTLWQYTLDTIGVPGQTRLAFYHFLQFYPILFLGFGYLVDRIYSYRRHYTYLILFLYLIFTLTSPKLSLHRAIGTEAGMDAPTMIDIAKTISEDVDTPYNIVYLPQSEYRAHALRYLLTYIYQVTPMGVEEYPSAKTIYVVGKSGLDLLTDRPWEVGAFNPKNQYVLSNTPNNLFSVYKLTQ